MKTFCLAVALGLTAFSAFAHTPPRERFSLDADWRFTKGDPPGIRLAYDDFGADATNQTEPRLVLLKPWILPTGNDFINDPAQRFVRPPEDFEPISYAQPGFDDASWQRVDLPHDWAVAGPFTHNGGGGMGRLPTAGVGWYRKKLKIPPQASGKRIYLDVDGAMAYAAVWFNGRIVGGWPYGYASWRVDLTPFVNFGRENTLAIRLENLPNSSRWYPGAGIYRHVWMVETEPVHVAHWGTQITTTNVSADSAAINLAVSLQNDSSQRVHAAVSTEIFPLDESGQRAASPVATLPSHDVPIDPGQSSIVTTSAEILHPHLWGPPPYQQPNRYVAVTQAWRDAQRSDVYETPFGIRSLRFDPNHGFFINGRHVLLNGVCDHHDLGPLGAALNVRALERQLQMLQDMGCNAIRTSHNPPAPELLELADKMGFLVFDEAFDVWERPKTPFDFHLVFPDWHEPDLRAQIRRDRNCPSVVLWSIGNEVGEQFTGEKGADVAKSLLDISHREDPTRPVTSAMNWAQPTNALPAVLDAIGLNYQGAGIRGAPGKYQAFHERFPDKFIFGSETASALSSRGEYLFPVATGFGAPVSRDSGEKPAHHQVSAYELYFAAFGASADKVFATQDQPFVGGEFVWTGWDYIGEPTPFDSSRSSYSGIIDLAGFKKDRFYLYQSHWRPELSMAHILPHWTWPERVGQITPVHVFTSGDEAELFLNGRSLGRKKKGVHQYRLRWDDVVYAPGTLKVVAYKDGVPWASDTVITAGDPARLALDPDRKQIAADGRDLAFITLRVTDKNGRLAPRACNQIHFEISGPGEIIATDNGDPADFQPFPSHDRAAFNGLCLAIVRAKPGHTGSIKLTTGAQNLRTAVVAINAVSQPARPPALGDSR